MRIFFLLFSFHCYCCEVLFYLQDAGETFALLPVAEQLRKDGVDVVVLVGGVAEGRGQSVQTFGVSIDPRGERSVTHGPAAALAVIDAFHPKVFISGVAFEWQGELYDACSKRGIASIAFWDNFSAEGEDPYFRMAHKVQYRADRLWVPSETVAKKFTGREGLYISGQPTLEKWAEEAARVDGAEIRNRLGLESPLSVFIGGYGAEYEKVFEEFLKTLHDELVLVQAHPKFGGKIESEILERYPHLNVRLLNGQISTIESVVIADLVICNRSTVGFQAQYIGKKVLWLPSRDDSELVVPDHATDRCVQYTKGMIL